MTIQALTAMELSATPVLSTCRIHRVNGCLDLCWLLGISDLKSGFSQNLKGEIDPVLPIYPLFTDRSLTLNQDGVCALTESASGTSTPSRAGFFPLGKQKEKTECPKASYSVSAPFGMGLREALHRFFALWQFQRNVHRITHQAMSTHAL